MFYGDSDQYFYHVTESAMKKHEKYLENSENS